MCLVPVQKAAGSAVAAITVALVLLLPRAHADLVIDTVAFQSFGDNATLEQHLDHVCHQAIDNGIGNLEPYARLLITLSGQAIECQDPGRALVLARYARRLAPDLPLAELALGRARWSQNRLRIDRLLAGYGAMVLKEFGYAWSLLFLVGSNLLVLLVTLWLCLLLFAGVCLLKYGGMWVHDLQHALPRGVPSGAVRALALVLAFLPPVLGCSLVWAGLLWIVVLYAYMTGHERIVAAAGVVLTAVAIPMLTATASWTVFMPQSDLVRMIWNANYGYCDVQCRERLEQAARTTSADFEVLFSLGLVNKKEQNYHTAAVYYERLDQHYPGTYAVLNNAGTVRLAEGRWDAAMDLFRQAVAAAPEQAAAAHFNIARAYQQKFMFPEAEQALVQAKACDSALVEHYQDIYAENYNRLVIDVPLSRGAIYRTGLQLFQDNDRSVGTFWNILFGGVPPAVAAVLLLVLFCVSLLAAAREKFRIALRCRLCGVVLCRRCQRTVGTEILCTQCHNFIQKQDKLPLKMRESKVREIQRRVDWYKGTGVWMSRVLPGAGHLWKGHCIRGILCTGVSVFLILKIAAGPFLTMPGSPARGIALAESGFLAVVLVLWWTAMVRSYRKLRSREIDDNVALKSVAVDA